MSRIARSSKDILNEIGFMRDQYIRYQGQVNRYQSYSEAAFRKLADLYYDLHLARKREEAKRAQKSLDQFMGDYEATSTRDSVISNSMI